jgi:excisionase family DNA binding protein
MVARAAMVVTGRPPRRTSTSRSARARWRSAPSTHVHAPLGHRTGSPAPGVQTAEHRAGHCGFLAASTGPRCGLRFTSRFPHSSTFIPIHSNLSNSPSLPNRRGFAKIRVRRVPQRAKRLFLRYLSHMALSDVELLTISEVAKILHVSVSSVHRWITEGKLRAIRLPSGHYRVRAADVEALLDDT